MATKRPKAKQKPIQIKVLFLKSPTGKYKLAYSKGDIVTLPVALAAELIEAKYAEKV